MRTKCLAVALGLAVVLAVFAAGSAQTETGISTAGLVTTDAMRLSTALGDIARQAIAFDQGSPTALRLDDLLRLELAAGEYQAALRTISERNALGSPQDEDTRLLNLRWSIYARARLAAGKGMSFDAAFSKLTTQTLAGLNGKDAFKFLYSLGTPLPYLHSNLETVLDRDRTRSRLSLTEAIALVRDWVAYTTYSAVQPLVARVADADDARRYVVDKTLQLPMDGGAAVCVLVVRPHVAIKLPTLLAFSIYDDPTVKLDDARRSAANGFAAVMGFTRGKGCSPGVAVPMLHDGDDGDAVIRWIARQPWSDGRVGMFGGSYEGFTQWAAAKHPPAALKALMPPVSYSPGVDFPMDGGVFMTYGFPWPFYTTDNKTLDGTLYYDSARWNRVEREWYVSGRAYQTLDQIAGLPNPIWDSWVRHPDYDAFWRGLKPSDAELAKLSIPVLTTTGYYDSGQSGALSYFTRYARANPRAENYLVVGPWDHHTAQLGGPWGIPIGPELRGLPLDPAAHADIIALRYAWFNWIFGRGPKPAILKDRVNYEVMGANVWKHAPSMAAMGPRPRRYYLGAGQSGEDHTLVAASADTTAAVQAVDFKDRSDVNRLEPFGPEIDQALDDWPIVTKATDLANSVTFLSAPFRNATEISGIFSGRLDVTCNRKDFDFAVTLFEVTAGGEWIQLSYDWQRASYAADPSVRKLLVPGRRTLLDFTARRLTSRLLASGSRLAIAISVIKQPGEEINYGSGKTVSLETIADATEPLRLRWWSDSYVDVPVAK